MGKEEQLMQYANMALNPYSWGGFLDDFLLPCVHSPHGVICLRKHHNGAAPIYSDDGFKVNIDVQQFRPEDITVKVVNNYVVVEGKHEERQDEHGYISRQFVRRYLLPDNVRKEAVESSLSADGVLTIYAPIKKDGESELQERVIPIIQTGVPAVREQPQECQVPEGQSKSDAALQETKEDKKE